MTNHRSAFSTIIRSKPLGTGERKFSKMASRMAPSSTGEYGEGERRGKEKKLCNT